jgi:hypothetical protein
MKFLHTPNCIYKTTKKDNYNRAAWLKSEPGKKVVVVFCINKDKKIKKQQEGWLMLTTPP